ncbi:hypothetical protein SAMN05216577_106153 [Pseudomonas citronellolis]|uniref:Uncharacterized protein n=1 Tax=Pseudomonas citronellolis TaxID=53408 RepID=A0AAQ1KER7_9PSED|nr:hypothetical protein [Pseudomonas citronellolis]TGC24225.1 hypothetical protein CW310_22935 [Pseudomonas citronellolis]SFC50242.1 hypothetical protein SAMN05216577_106153 [Pseudomonas citronellolis]
MDYEAKALQFREEIEKVSKECLGLGVKEPFGMGTAIVLTGKLIHALERIEQLEGKLKGLSEQATALEERGLKYCGTWQRAMDYRRGDCVTHKGCLWTAVKATDKVPDEAVSDWQLSAKGATR